MHILPGPRHLAFPHPPSQDNLLFFCLSDLVQNSHFFPAEVTKWRLPYLNAFFHNFFKIALPHATSRSCQSISEKPQDILSAVINDKRRIYVEIARISVENTKLEIKQDARATVGMTGCSVIFEYFGPEWQGLSKTAVFHAGSESRDVINVQEGKPVIIPWEVLTQACANLIVGICGTV